MRTTPLGEAQWVHARVADYDMQQRFDAAASLSEWGIFSQRQVAQLTGLSLHYVRGLAPKHDRTGGKFDPASLDRLVEISEQKARGEAVAPADVKEALEAGGGTSFRMAARLTGASESWLRRTYAKA